MGLFDKMEKAIQDGDVEAVVIVPTRELAMQTSFVIKELGKHKKIECMVSTGGNPVKEDIYRLYQTVHVIVATPGRILDLASKNIAKLNNCKMLVLDEVDFQKHRRV